MSTGTLPSEFEAVIGLEIHAQLLTNTKAFAPEKSTYGESPNRQVSVISLAHPGTLPRLNRTAIEYAIRMGLAVGSRISQYQIFDRKNYFYPDLPKGYQLTQDRTPVCVGGSVSVRLRDGTESSVLLNRIHLEEDAGKSMHLDGEEDTAVDFNRAGVALIEIVTEPVIKSSDEAVAVLMEVRKLVRYLAICDGNMEEGSFRCDANVSVRRRGHTKLGKKVEVKNMNSFRNVQRAIDYEIDRQSQLLASGTEVVSETRTFDVGDGHTYGMRTKEELNDYRYFPDPDLSPVWVSDEWLESIRSEMPELPAARHARFIQAYSLSAYDAGVLTESRELATLFELVAANQPRFKAVANWLMGPVKTWLNEHRAEANQFPVRPATLARLIEMVEEGMISFGIAAQQLLPVLCEDPDADPDIVAKQLNLLQESDEEALTLIVAQVLKEFPLKVEEFHKGKKALLGMFMGEIMKRTAGKADPKVTNGILARKLNELK
ncbi:MAG: Asp-tRNA(Asn)/Glu-tRNA(Gln) amidotransferase subunit GatB [Cyclobacteriaceae bacterium]|nr:Asp-tRNA(Asn)/Glu-tRNA(Gln) amidotransferase subunit GatB [Cyclobacteriaceae bacterium]